MKIDLDCRQHQSRCRNFEIWSLSDLKNYKLLKNFTFSIPILHFSIKRMPGDTAFCDSQNLALLLCQYGHVHTCLACLHTSIGEFWYFTLH